MKNKIIQNMIRKMEAGRTMHRKNAMKLTAIALCTALFLGETGVTMYALAADNKAGQETSETNETTDTSSSIDTAENTDTTQPQNETGEGSTGRSGEGTRSEGTTSRTEDGKLAKEETVYVLAGADGSTHKIIVSNWLKNGTGADSLKDVSELSNIENVNGDETFTSETGDRKVWDAKGQDIYYQGSTDKELPVDISITYKLNGKEISPEELAGKSGKVTIRFDYTNQQYEYKEINGVRTKVYVPFAAVTGMILDDEIFTNVEVSGGKLINDGSRTIAMGIALPGLQESLAIDPDKLDIPNSFEITADVKGFELGMTATLVTNELFNEIDIEDGDMLEELNQAMDELTDAMEQLKDGSSQLYDGISTLLDKSGELIQGIDKLSDGASQLQSGIGILDDGVAKLQNGAVSLQNGATSLQNGAASLQSGLNTLVSKNGELNGGAQQVFDTLLATANSQLAAAGLQVPSMTVENYAEVLNQVIASLDGDSIYQQAYEQVSAAVNANRGEIETAVTAVVRENVIAQVTAAVRTQVTAQVTAGAEAEVTAAVLQTMGMTKEEYDAALSAGLIDEQTQAAVTGAVNSQMASDDIQAKISAATDAQMASADVQAIIETNTEQQMASEEVQSLIASNVEAQIQNLISENMNGETVQGQLAAASEGAKSVIALKASLDSYNAFYLGLQAYTTGVAQASDGAGQLKNGADQLRGGVDQLRGGVDELRGGTGQLYNGASELYNGVKTMKESSPALTDGIKQLQDGALNLYDGLCQFDEEGIQKLADAVNGDLDSLVERLKATSEVSKNYQSFSGIDHEMEGQVKFIYRTDSIEIQN